MKKENKKLAQEKRAMQRKKEANKTLIKNILKFGLPALAVIALVVLIIWDPFTASTTDTEGSGSAESTSDDTSTDTTSLLTDSSLTVKNGDTVNIDYVGYVDGVAFDGGNTQGMGTDLTIGSGAYIDDFEEQLIGYHPGDSVEVNVTFPENYGKENLNGKDAVFEVVINGIYE